MRILLKTFAGLLILLVILIAVIVFLPDKQYLSIAQVAVKQMTNRELSINQLKTQRSLNPSIEITNFAYANPDWAVNPSMIEGENLFISIDLEQLIKGKLHVNDFNAKGLKVDLVKNESGDANWLIAQKEKSPKQDFDIKALTKIDLRKFDLDDAQIDYRDEQAKLQYRLKLPTMFLNQDVEREQQHVEAKGVFNDLPFSIDGNLGLLDSLVWDKRIPFNLSTVLNQSNVNLKGTLEHKTDGFYLDTHASAHTPNLTDLSAFTLNELPSIGPISVSADVTGNLKEIAQTGIDVSNLDVKVDDPSIMLDINGDLSGLAATNKGDVNIELDVTDLSKLLKVFGIEKDIPGTLKLHGRAMGEAEDFGLAIHKATLNSDLLNAQLKGNIGDLLKGARASVDIELNAPNLELINHLFNQPMPEQWGPISATAKLTGDKNHYSLVDIQAQLDGKSKLKATGEINNLLKFEQMNLDVEATLASLSEISTFTHSPLPDMGPMYATGKINWQDGLLSLTEAVADYDGQYGKAHVTGRIGDLVHFDIVRLKADAEVPNLDVAEIFSGVQMPKIGKISATADLVSPTPLDLSAKNLKAQYDVDGITLTATGAINSLIKRKADMDLQLSGKLQSLASLNSLLKSELPVIGPITADAKLVGAYKQIELNQIKALLSDSALYGSVEGDLGRVFEIKGIDLKTDLTTPSLDLFFFTSQHGN